jgi:murein DD-endopeptidase MepM/ murein hydrolase activator NlpD
MRRLAPNLSFLNFLSFLSIVSTAVILPAIAPITTAIITPIAAQDQCNSVFSRLRSHKVGAGETIESIANRYSLIAQTLLSFNPILNQGLPSVGTDILIPPVNGIAISVPSGTTWAGLARRYGVRSDVLFELNGCQSPTSVVFLPGINWTSSATPQRFQSAIDRYPLAQPTQLLLAYGFYGDPAANQFHSGIDLAAPLGATVVAAGNGVVAFVGEQNPWGKMVVINHGNGQQSRYAHLGSISVTAGQEVRSGSPIGTVGNTGSPHSSQPHLHFEVRINSPAGALAQDPELYLAPLDR